MPISNKNQKWKFSRNCLTLNVKIKLFLFQEGGFSQWWGVPFIKRELYNVCLRSHFQIFFMVLNKLAQTFQIKFYTAFWTKLHKKIFTSNSVTLIFPISLLFWVNKYLNSIRTILFPGPENNFAQYNKREAWYPYVLQGLIIICLAPTCI